MASAPKRRVIARKPQKRSTDRGPWVAGAITASAAAVAVASWLGVDGLAFAQTFVVDPKRVIDGDTFYVSVRVVGADTPEIGDNARCANERAWGERASKRTAELLNGNVILQIIGVDRYNRLLAKVILPDGRDLAEVLITENLAVPYSGGAKPNWCQ